MRQTTSLIKRLCDARGIRYSWLAEQAGVSVWMFNHVEAGRKKAPHGYYEKIARVLGVPLDVINPPRSVESESDAVPA